MSYVVPRQSFERDMFVREYPADHLLGTLLFLHGLGSWGRCFQPVLCHPGLAHWRKLVPDLPGHGKSLWPKDPIGFDQVADHVIAWLEGRNEAPLVVVGHSLGGVVGQLIGEKNPDCVGAVFDVEGNIGSEDCTFSGRVARQTILQFVPDGYHRLCNEIYRASRNNEPLRDYYVSLCMCDPNTYYAHSVELVELSHAGTLASRLASLTMPVTYFAGSPQGIAETSIQQLSEAHVDLSVIAPAGHVLFADQPDMFVKELLLRLDGIVEPKKGD